MISITEAVILMAGTGSRLRAGSRSLPKPLIPIGGRPLISYTLDAMLQVGITTLHAVVGCESERLLEGLAPLIPSGIRLHPIHNPEWKKQNGVSVLCAAGKVEAPFFLVMGDHLFHTTILEDLLVESDPELLNLAIDRKIASVFDLNDAMKVQTKGDRVCGIGKTLAEYDAIDTGVFLCSNALFAYLRAAQVHGDCSLADGVRLMANEGEVRAIDIKEAWWQDVDTPEMLERAEEDFTAIDLPLASLSRQAQG